MSTGGLHSPLIPHPQSGGAGSSEPQVGDPTPAGGADGYSPPVVTAHNLGAPPRSMPELRSFRPPPSFLAATPPEPPPSPLTSPTSPVPLTIPGSPKEINEPDPRDIHDPQPQEPEPMPALRSFHPPSSFRHNTLPEQSQLPDTTSALSPVIPPTASNDIINLDERQPQSAGMPKVRSFRPPPSSFSTAPPPEHPTSSVNNQPLTTSTMAASSSIEIAITESQPQPGPMPRLSSFRPPPSLLENNTPLEPPSGGSNPQRISYFALSRPAPASSSGPHIQVAQRTAFIQFHPPPPPPPVHPGHGESTPTGHARTSNGYPAPLYNQNMILAPLPPSPGAGRSSPPAEDVEMVAADDEHRRWLSTAVPPVRPPGRYDPIDDDDDDDTEMAGSDMDDHEGSSSKRGERKSKIKRSMCTLPVWCYIVLMPRQDGTNSQENKDGKRPRGSKVSHQKLPWLLCLTKRYSAPQFSLLQRLFLNKPKSSPHWVMTIVDSETP